MKNLKECEESSFESYLLHAIMLNERKNLFKKLWLAWMEDKFLKLQTKYSFGILMAIFLIFFFFFWKTNNFSYHLMESEVSKPSSQ